MLSSAATSFSRVRSLPARLSPSTITLATALRLAVVLVERRDLLVAGRHELLDDLFGLVVVARAHVEHVAVHRSAQQFSAREGPDQRHFGFGEDGQGCACGRRAHVRY